MSIRRPGPPAGTDLDGFQETYAAAELAEDPEAHPEHRASYVDLVDTQMMTVDEALGFARHRVWGELEKRLRSAEG